ncbi:MAG TPA: hypothetical protein VI320_32275 [Terracidiphilus sp.]
MNGEPVSVQAIACRFLSFVLALFVYGADLSCATGQAASNTTKIFRDDALNITYFDSADCVPALSGIQVAPVDESKCIKPTLFANSVTAGGNCSFTFSTIDNTCPELVHKASELRSFMRELALLQLKQYGEPTINEVPVLYTIAGHPAAITEASVSIPASPGKLAQTIYAAKACALGNIPAKSHKSISLFVLGSSRWLPGRENTSRLIFVHAATKPWWHEKRI